MTRTPTCTREKAILLHGMLDDELDAANVMLFEEHLKGCSLCRDEYARQKAIRDSLRAPDVAYKAPASLRDRLDALIPDEAPVASARQNVKPLRSLRSRWWVGGASLALAAGLALFIALPQTQNDSLQQQLVDSHVRSMLADHLIDVVSSDHHTVKPWFNGKVPVAPEAVNLASAGFPLAGGRLDYVNRRTVAAVVYRHGGHVVNLYVWPSPNDKDAATQISSRQGYNLLHWVQAGTTFWVVSDAAVPELQEFVSDYVKESAVEETPVNAPAQ
jgi:anti-sigma factor RsiW